MSEYVIFLEAEGTNATRFWFKYVEQGATANDALNTLVNVRAPVHGGLLRSAEVYVAGGAICFDLDPEQVKRYRLVKR